MALLASSGEGPLNLSRNDPAALEEYSLLDPRYITRLEPGDISGRSSSTSSSNSSGGGGGGGGNGGGTGGDGNGSSQGVDSTANAAGGSTSSSANSGSTAALPASGAFQLRVPLSDIVGLDLTPTMIINVDVDDTRGKVRTRGMAARSGAARKRSEGA